MKKSFNFLVLFYFLVSCFSLNLKSQVVENSDEQKIVEILQTISSEDLFAYVDTLSSDQFEGRLTGHAGYDRAAEWTIKKFKEWNVKPLGVDGSYLQKFPHPYSDVFEGCKVTMVDEKGNVIKDFEYIEEFIPGSTSGNGEVTAEVVYVGYGISAPELAYDDYEGIDVKGKIVLIDKELPVKSDVENFLKWRPYSFHQYKLLNAVKHGATGMLYNYPIGNPNNAYAEGFIISHIGEKETEGIFEGNSKTHKEIVKSIKEKVKPESFNTNKIFTIKNNMKYHPEGVGSNVIGFIEGSDSELKDEFVMVGGHLDFLGMCYDLMPGANDNASAVSVTLALANAISKLETKPKRSIVFILIGAEEAALKGIQYFLKNPTIELDKLVGFINMDGVGIGDKIWVGFAENQPDFYSYLEDVNNKYVNTILKGSYSTNITRPRQDAAFVDWYGIPVLSLGTFGNLPQNKASRYHTPYDNIKHITPEIMESMTKILFASIVNIANEENLDFKRGEKKPELINGYDFQSLLEDKK